MPFDRDGKLSREELIEAAVRPIAELTEDSLAYADKLVAYDKIGKLVTYSRRSSKCAPIPALESLLKDYDPTWVGSMFLRFADSQGAPRPAKNQYVYLKPNEKLFVMHKLLFPHTSFSHVVEECTIPATDDGLSVRWCAGIEPSEVCNLTSDGQSLLDGFQLANEAKLNPGKQEEER
jgi:hypothetical protein